MRHLLTVRSAAALALAIIVAIVVYRRGEMPVASAASAKFDHVDHGNQPLPVEVVRAQPIRSFGQTTTLTGMVQPQRKSELGFEMSGKLIAVQVDEGERVRQGQVLAEIDTRRLVAQRKRLAAQRREAAVRKRQLDNGPRQERIDAAMARVRQRNAQFEDVRRAAERNEQLVESRSISVSEYDTSRFVAESAAATLEAAKQELVELAAGARQEEIDAQAAVLASIDAAIEEVEVQIDQAVLKAPYDGTISSRYVDEGSVLSAGAPVFRMVDSRNLEAHVGLPIDLASHVSPGTMHQLLVEDGRVAARLRTVLPEVSSETQTRVAVLDFETDVSRATPPVGAVARWELSRQTQTDGFWVPTSSLDQGSRGLWIVWSIESSTNPICATQRGDCAHQR